jgi:group II intron reverse transcriptase/maturase
VHIPKGDGQKTRPIGIPTFEDKVLQRAVVMVLQEVYEQDFLDCSYGFRPGRSAHQALERLWHGLMDMGGGWVADVDIKGFFDTLDHTHLRAFIRQRVRDGVLCRTIDKWLNAGVLEEGAIRRSETGSPQGGVVSPLLANIYLHEVLDKWFHGSVLPRLRGRAFMVRYADDVVLVFSAEQDARRVMDILPKRFGKYGLTLHPDKTKLVEFRPRGNRPNKGGPRDGTRSGTFDFLGFTHYWDRSRRGAMVVRRKTASTRFRRALRNIREWCKRNRHEPIKDQFRALGTKLRGYYAYFGITGNRRWLSNFYYQVRRAWRYWLNRRSQRGGMDWSAFERLERTYFLPTPIVVHAVGQHAARPWP